MRSTSRAAPTRSSHHGPEAHRPLRDDEEDLGLREEEAAGQEVELPDPGRIVLTLPGAFRTLRFAKMPRSGSSSFDCVHAGSTSRSGWTSRPGSSAGALASLALDAGKPKAAAPTFPKWTRSRGSRPPPPDRRRTSASQARRGEATKLSPRRVHESACDEDPLERTASTTLAAKMEPGAAPAPRHRHLGQRARASSSTWPRSASRATRAGPGRSPPEVLVGSMSARSSRVLDCLVARGLRRAGPRVDTPNGVAVSLAQEPRGPGRRDQPARGRWPARASGARRGAAAARAPGASAPGAASMPVSWKP